MSLLNCVVNVLHYMYIIFWSTGIHLFQVKNTSAENGNKLEATANSDLGEPKVMIIIVALLVPYNLKKGQRQLCV